MYLISLIGHQVVFATLNHDLNPHKRNNMKASPIIIKDDVLIGAHATILAELQSAKVQSSLPER